MPQGNFSAIGKPPAWLQTQQNKISAIGEEAKYEKVLVSLIDLNPDNKIYNENDTEEDISDLAESIKTFGLQTPLVVVKQKNSNRYLLLSGERRLKAVKLLNHKKVMCVVHSNLSFVDEESIKHLTNLEPRNLTPEQRFKAYCSWIITIEKATPDERKKTESILNINRKKRKEYQTILENLSAEQMTSFNEGVLTYSDIKEIAFEQDRLNKQQQRLNDAVVLFAEAKENADKKIYKDDSSRLYYVSLDKRTNEYVVFYRDFTTNMPPYQLRSSELKPCPDEKTMQIFLDKYAVTHNLQMCSEEESLSLIREGNSKDNNDIAEKREKMVKATMSPFPEIINQVQDDDANAFIDEDEKDYFDDEIINYDNEDNFEDDTVKTPTDFSVEKKDISNDTNENTHLENTTVEPSLNSEIKTENTESKGFDFTNKIFEAKELETGKTLQGYLVSGKEGLYIIRGNINIGKEVHQGNILAYNASMIICKIDPDTVKLIDKE